MTRLLFLSTLLFLSCYNISTLSLVVLIAICSGGAGGETSEVWTPDIELWNLEEGLRESFDDAYAIVSYDGSVWWSRPGHLRPACKFYGLREFPFDKLSCAIEFGSWVYSGKYMRLVKGGGTGYSIGGSETAGESFNEFSFVEENAIDCKEVVYPPYPASPEEDWPGELGHVYTMMCVCVCCSSIICGLILFSQCSFEILPFDLPFTMQCCCTILQLNDHGNHMLGDILQYKYC